MTKDDCISRQAAIDDLKDKDPSQIWDTADIEVWINSLPSAQPEIKTDGDTISRQQTIDALMQEFKRIPTNSIRAKLVVENLPSAQPERKTGRMSNKDWIDFLCEQFDISRTSARDMLHGMMKCKKEDNFKRVFNPMLKEGEG